MEGFILHGRGKNSQYRPVFGGGLERCRREVWREFYRFFGNYYDLFCEFAETETDILSGDFWRDLRVWQFTLQRATNWRLNGSMNISSRPTRSKIARTLAMSLAQEQGEELELRRALRLIKKYEEAINAPPTARSRGASTKRVLEYKASEHEPSPRNETSILSKRLLAKLQNSLKRYKLMKRVRSRFSLDCEEDEFLSLFKGHVDIYKCTKTGYYYCKVEGSNSAEVSQKLGEIMGMPNSDTKAGRWFTKRYYGEDLTIARDCGYLKIDPNHAQRQSVNFSWKGNWIKQIDYRGEFHGVASVKMQVSLPRHVKSVKPKGHVKGIKKKKIVA